MRDITGGTIHLGLMAIGGVFAYLGVTNAHFYVNGERYSMKLPGLIAGSAFLLGGTVFNITRSAFFHVEPKSWKIAVLPGKNGIEKVFLSWTLRF